MHVTYSCVICYMYFVQLLMYVKYGVVKCVSYDSNYCSFAMHCVMQFSCEPVNCSVLNILMTTASFLRLSHG